ncbi:unnamed protein product [Boreogadus saida]
MGQHGSKSSMEERMLIQSLASIDEQRVYLNEDTHDFKTHCLSSCTLQMRGRPWDIQDREGRRKHSPWQHRHSTNTSGLVYVVDNPTGGVWVKPKERWNRY